MKAGIDFGTSMTDLVILDNSKVVHKDSFKKGNHKKIREILKDYNIKNVSVTGAYSSLVPGCVVKKVNEMEAIGKGGLFVSGFKKALVVSVGSGTAMVSCSNSFKHIGGTPIGGRTLEGLARLLLKVDDLGEIEKMAEKGDISRVDLMIKDIYPSGIGLLNDKASASHFGKLKGCDKSDLALGLINMAAQSIGTLAVFGAKASGRKKIVLTGGLTRFAMFRKVIRERINTLSDIPVEIPQNSSVATAIGACLLA